MSTYCVRIRFRLGERVRIETTEPELALDLEEGRRIVLRPSPSGASIREAEQLALFVQPYATEAEALDAGTRWRAMVEKAFARLNIGADFGDRAATGAATQHGWGPCRFGRRLRSPTVGSHPATRSRFAVGDGAVAAASPDEASVTDGRARNRGRSSGNEGASRRDADSRFRMGYIPHRCRSRTSTASAKASTRSTGATSRHSARDSEIRLEVSMAWLYTFDEAVIATRVEVFESRDKALTAAVGLGE